MNNEVRLPIKTTQKGDEISKVCVEDCYKIVNRVVQSMDKAYNNSIDILDSVHKKYDGYEGELIIGTGNSKPCGGDKFDVEIGHDIAFMKAKLNANFKKRNFLRRVYNEYVNVLILLNKEMQKIDDYIDYDVKGIRTYNPEYLIDEV